MARHLSIERDFVLRLALDVRSLRLKDDQFYRLCRDNPELRLELTADGELIIMPPVFSGTGWRNSEINYRLAHWAKQDGTGICFDSSTGFTLPNGAKRSPDASWILRNRWERLTPRQQNREFAPICPDFVVELRSPSDRLPDLKKKLAEYIRNGARMGWLLDPLEKRAYVYRPGRVVRRFENPTEIIGAEVLPEFRFNFQDIV